ncbi:PRKD1 family protein [Megaselia abdita]
MEGPEVTFLFQFGNLRDGISIPSTSLNLKSLKDLACDFINNKVPNNGLSHLPERILLFRHNYTSPNVLQMINSASEVIDETLIEIVLTASPLTYPSIETILRPHQLNVHSYRAPTFCDFCGEMMFGLVRQGLKCDGCSQNYHKRCAVKIPNNCLKANESSRRSSNQPPSKSPMSGSTTSLLSEDQLKNDSSGSLNVPAVFRSNRSPSTGSRNSAIYSGQIRIPHTFMVHTYGIPTVCQYCKKLLRGLFKQGVQCKDCQYNAHKKCLDKVPQDCSGERQVNLSDFKEEKDMFFREEFDDSEGENETESSKSSFKPPPIPEANGLDSQSENSEYSEQSSSSSSPSANIPLMRIVQSVKHTKKRGGQAIKEGWLVHFTNLDKTVKRYFWRLDSKSVTLFISEQGSKYHKEIPLAEMLSIDTNRHLTSAKNYCFEIRTANVDYFVGQDPLVGIKEEPVRLPAPDTGIGSDIAKSWETTIKQAYVHVTNTQCYESEDKIQDMGQLYQIFPDEVLGSGQFGVVYGGTHKKTKRDVAIKVIDKLRFPTKQEAQLKNEVAILQNINHCGVVNLERMFETPERIFVVMEKLKGDMLEMILSSERGKLNERVTKFLITQILIALKYLHSQNIVHCDLKPENVLLSSDAAFPQVKLCDFGYARIIGEKSFRRSVVGTPAYLGKS